MIDITYSSDLFDFCTFDLIYSLNSRLFCTLCVGDKQILWDGSRLFTKLHRAGEKPWDFFRCLWDYQSPPKDHQPWQLSWWSEQGLKPLGLDILNVATELKYIMFFSLQQFDWWQFRKHVGTFWSFQLQQYATTMVYRVVEHWPTNTMTTDRSTNDQHDAKILQQSLGGTWRRSWDANTNTWRWWPKFPCPRSRNCSRGHGPYETLRKYVLSYRSSHESFEIGVRHQFHHLRTCSSNGLDESSSFTGVPSLGPTPPPPLAENHCWPASLEIDHLDKPPQTSQHCINRTRHINNLTKNS